MPEQHAMARNERIPALLLAVLHDEVFLIIGSSHRHHVCLVAVVQVRQDIEGIYPILQHGQVEPSQTGTLVGRECRRRIAVVVVGSPIHGIEGTRGKGCHTIIYIIMIGKAEHMTEFMHEGTDARRLRCDDGTIDFVTAGIVSHLDAIQLQRLLGNPSFLGDISIIGRMWPDGIAITRISLTLSGIEEIDIVDEAILVVIILRKIHQWVGKSTSLSHELLQGYRIIRRRTLVGSIIRILLWQCYRADDIKLRLEFAIGAVHIEISRTSVGTIAISKTRFIEHTVEELMRIATHGRELRISKLHQDDQ